MMVSERLKPVRERWSRKMRTNAMPMSEAALSTFTTREMFTIFTTSENVVNVALHIPRVISRRREFMKIKRRKEETSADLSLRGKTGPSTHARTK